jgi:RNA polymerase sigma-70 factor (ECF subfamily)
MLQQLADDPQLATYPYLAIARADFSQRVGDTAAARMFFEEAHLLTANSVERAYIERRLAELGA